MKWHCFRERVYGDACVLPFPSWHLFKKSRGQFSITWLCYNFGRKVHEVVNALEQRSRNLTTVRRNVCTEKNIIPKQSLYFYDFNRITFITLFGFKTLTAVEITFKVVFKAFFCNDSMMLNKTIHIYSIINAGHCIVQTVFKQHIQVQSAQLQMLA